MPALERRLAVRRGASFRLNDGVEMFDFIMDASTRMGERPATDADRKEHAEAYARFLADENEWNARIVNVKGDVRPDAEPGPYAERRQRAKDEGRA